MRSVLWVFLSFAFYFLLFLYLFPFLMTDGDSMTINNLRDSAKGTFVTLDDYLSLTSLSSKWIFDEDLSKVLWRQLLRGPRPPSVQRPHSRRNVSAVDHQVPAAKKGKKQWETRLQDKFGGSEEFQLDANRWPCGVRHNIAQKWKHNENQITIQSLAGPRNFSLMQIDDLVVYDRTSPRNGKNNENQITILLRAYQLLDRKVFILNKFTHQLRCSICRFFE